MKTVRFHKTGGPEVLIYEDVPDPIPKDGEVLIRIEAVGMNFADVMRRSGDDYPEPLPAPFILGAEVAGTIAAVGNGDTSLEVGPQFSQRLTPADRERQYEMTNREWNDLCYFAIASGDRVTAKYALST